jgi:hypothetical protein
MRQVQFGGAFGGYFPLGVLKDRGYATGLGIDARIKYPASPQIHVGGLVGFARCRDGAYRQSFLPIHGTLEYLPTALSFSDDKVRFSFGLESGPSITRRSQGSPGNWSRSDAVLGLSVAPKVGVMYQLNPLDLFFELKATGGTPEGRSFISLHAGILM